MNLHTPLRDACTRTRSLWFVLAAEASLAELEEAIRILRPHLRGPGESRSMLILPQEAIAPSLADRLGLSSASHGSVLTPAEMFLLPPDRLFVLEDRVLHLRPRDIANRISPVEHLLPSLIEHYGNCLHILPLRGTALPDGDIQSLIATFSARIVSLEALRSTGQSDADAPQRGASRPVAAKTMFLPSVPPIPVHLAHELRQPLETATLLQGRLASQVREPHACDLLERLGETLRVMADLLTHQDELSTEEPGAPAPELLAGVRQAFKSIRNGGAERTTRERATHCLQTLTRRQIQIMAMVLEGYPSKIIAANLGISQRTVENHRAAIMKKTGSRSLPALARLAMMVEPQPD